MLAYMWMANCTMGFPETPALYGERGEGKGCVFEILCFGGDGPSDGDELNPTLWIPAACPHKHGLSKPLKPRRRFQNRVCEKKPLIGDCRRPD